MKYLLYFIQSFFLLNMLAPNHVFSQGHRYHIIEYTASDPVIKKRCVDSLDMDKSQSPYVQETIDSLSRCIQLKFFDKEGTYFRSADFPSIIQYEWTDSSLVETLYEQNNLLFSPEYMVRPNKIEYLLNDSKVTEARKYYNGKFVESTTISDRPSLDNYVFFLMYSGCKLKFNKKYQIEF